MPQYKLYYFPLRGRAEPARLCFAAGGVNYEDIRFTSEEWQLKKKEGFSPSGRLPMLVVDGKKLNESMAIMRYAARQSGLSPADSFDVACCDMVVDMTSDFMSKAGAVFYEKDEERKKVLAEELKSTHMPKYITNTTNLLKGGKAFFVGDKLTYADIMVYYCIDMVKQLKDLLDDNPDLKAHFERVGNIPNIKKWIETRPKTDM